MPYIRKYPVGYVGYNVSSMRENQMEDIFQPTDSRLVAVNVGADGACGDLVCDTNQNNAFDPMRSAWLQSVFRVIKQPLGSFNAVGFQLNESGRRDTKGGYFIDKGDGGTATVNYTYDGTGNQIATVRGTNVPLPKGIIIGQGSYLDGGPFHVGNKKDKHRHGADADGNPINALHLWTGALFYRNQVEDGPLRFEATPYKTGQDQAVIVPVHLTWAGNDWAWYSTTYVYKPNDHPPPYYPPDGPWQPGTPDQPWEDPDPFDPFDPGHGGDDWDSGDYPGGGSGGGALEDPNDPGVVGPAGLSRDDGQTGSGQQGGNTPPLSFQHAIDPMSFSGTMGTPAFYDSGSGSAFNSVMGTSSVGQPPMEMLATTAPIASTAGGFQASNYGAAASDAGTFSQTTPTSASKSANSSPMTGGFSSFAAQGGTTAAGTTPSGAPFPASTSGAQGDPWSYKASPKGQLMPGLKKSKWASGTANGGIVYHPAETDLRDASSNGMVPSNVDLNTFLVMVAPNAYFGCGVPELVTGGIKSGYRWGVDSTTGDLVFHSVSSSQAPQSAVTFTNTSQRIRWYATQTYYGELTHANTANRTYTFQDASGTVAFIGDIPTAISKAMLGFGGLVGAATGAMTRWGNGTDASLAVDNLSSEIEMTSAGSLKNLRVTSAAAFGVGNSVVFTVRVNGSDTAITATLSGLTTSAQDTSNTVAVVAGDQVEIKVSVGGGVPLNTASVADLEIDWS